MPTTQKWILISFMIVLVMTIGILFMGLYFANEGVITFGMDIGKFVFGSVVGSLAAAFAPTSGAQASTEKRAVKPDQSVDYP